MFEMQNPPDRHSYRLFLLLSLVVLSSLAYLSSRFSSQAPLAQTSESAPARQAGGQPSNTASTRHATPDSALPASSQVNRASAKQVYGRLPLSFVANRGQTDSQVQFLARGSGYNLFLKSAEAVLTLHKHES